MRILIVNPGSFSIKCKLFVDDKELMYIAAENIGQSCSVLKTRIRDKIAVSDTHFYNHDEAIIKIFSFLTKQADGKIDVVAIRTVSAVQFNGILIPANHNVLARMDNLAHLTPLHQPFGANIIRQCLKKFADSMVYIANDSGFFADIPHCNAMYAVDCKIREHYGIRKIGYHGFSHSYMARAATANGYGKKIITCHLGGGSSISAVYNEKCLDTTMGFSPCSGLPMSTRAGELDVIAALYIMEKENWSAMQMEEYLYNSCGFLGVSGVTGEFGRLRALAKSGDSCAKLAIDNYLYCLKKAIGAYAALMNGVDCIVFGGAISAYNPDLLLKILREMSYLGIVVNKLQEDKLYILTDKTSSVAAFVIDTDEESEIVRTIIEKGSACNE